MRLGRTDLRISRVGLGTWQFSDAWGTPSGEMAVEVVSRALDLGINFFDTAMVYGMGTSERLLGEALREAGADRDDLVISTKVPGEFLNKLDVPISVEKSLKNLGLDYVDVLLAHWPPCWHNFPLREYAKAMERLVNMGKVRYLGLSDHPIELVESFRNYLSRADVEVLQVRYNLVERWAEAELIPYAEKHGMTVQAWSPIAKGALTGKYPPGSYLFEDVRSNDPVFHPENYEKVWEAVELLKEIGEKYGKKPAQVALNWLLMSSPVVVPIPGAKTSEQVEDLVGAVGWRMNYSDWLALHRKTTGMCLTYSVRYVL